MFKLRQVRPSCHGSNDRNISGRILNLENITSYIEIPSSHSIEKKFKLLIDTGADISLIKLHSLCAKIPVNENIKFVLKGVNDTQNPIKTLGTVHIKFHSFSNPIYHFMNIIPTNSTNIPLDGLLGNYFLHNNNPKIDYENNCQDKIIFCLHIPLLDNKIYNLFKLIPLPILIKRSYFSIHPSRPYLAYSINKDHYALLSNFDNCQLIHPEEYICIGSFVLYSNHVDQIYEMSMIHKKDILQTQIL
ncbi:MAG: envelope fusion protein [Brevinema sp.]